MPQKKSGQKGKTCSAPSQDEAKVKETDEHGWDIFATTRMTLLCRVNAGDEQAFTEFYNLYCPPMLKHLGLTANSKVERWEQDLVQQVFLNFYKRFAMVKDQDTGEKRVPASLFTALNPVNKKTGQHVHIKFRQYLLTALDNAKKDHWKKETKKGKLNLISLDQKIGDNGNTSLVDLIEDENSNPENRYQRLDADSRYDAMVKVFDLVMKAMVLDDSVEEVTKKVFQRLVKGEDPSAIAEDMGITANNVYQIKNRCIAKAGKAARAVFKFVGGADAEYEETIKRLWREIADGKIKHYDKFMVGLAKEMTAK